ncbi:hypothetical protein Tco_1580052, partial [Tanacetum coccineum]
MKLRVQRVCPAQLVTTSQMRGAWFESHAFHGGGLLPGCHAAHSGGATWQPDPTNDPDLTQPNTRPDLAVTGQLTGGQPPLTGGLAVVNGGSPPLTVVDHRRWAVASKRCRLTCQYEVRGGRQRCQSEVR